MMRALSFPLALLAAMPAHAQTCFPPDIPSSYASAAHGPFDYVIAHGRLVETGPAELYVHSQTGTEDWEFYSIPARFDGQFFNATEFDQRRTVPITVEVSCPGGVCGPHGDVRNGLFFLRLDAGPAYALAAPPCPFWVFPDPTEADLRQVVACHAEGGC